MEKFKITATIEARMTSSRLPGKVLKPILGRPVLELLIERLKRSQRLDEIVLATTTNAADEPIIELCRKIGIPSFRGSEEDVLSRVLGAARSVAADIIVEITGDCPLIDPWIVDECINLYLRCGADYVSNFRPKTFPGGLEVQVFSTQTLASVEALTQDKEDREHVSLYIYTHPERFQLKNFPAPPNMTMPELVCPLDTPEDYQMITEIFEALYPKNPAFGTEEILGFLKQNPHLLRINENVKRTIVKKLQNHA